MWPLILGIIVIILLVVIFFVTYISNKRTAVPPECESIAESVKCESCTELSCAFSAINKIKEEDKKKEDN